MLRTTQWRPDTCGCVLEYEWDDATTEDARVHTPIVAVPCPAHMTHADAAAKGVTNPAARARRKAEGAHAQVLKENQGKNRAIGKILERLPAVTREVEHPNGEKVRELRPENPVSWSFDAERNLTVKVKGVPDAQVRAAIAD